MPAQYLGLPTLGVAGSGSLPEGDCFDASEEDFEDPTEEFLPADVNPAVAEVWYDGVDANCDGLSDYDQDMDGVDSDAHSGSDCDDLDAAIHPLAEEVYYDGVDQNCDELSDYDADGDGQDSLEYDGLDCNDDNPAILASGGAEIYYNGIDDNCDLSDGDGDMDGDGYWSVEYPFTEDGVDPFVEYPTALDDCWDDANNPPAGFLTTPLNGFHGLTSAQVNPAETERFYDGIDQNCDGEDDFDQDSDGFQSDAYLNLNGNLGDDCVDSVEEEDFVSGSITPTDIYPNNPADAWYDGNDQNCDGLNDFDQDQDGQESSDHGGNDCNDIDPNIYADPNFSNLTEGISDGVDQNCDGLESCYIDSDEDTFGATSVGDSADLSCLETGFANNATDCDDDDGTIYPSALELCDGQINDCNGSALPSDEMDNDSDNYVECNIDSGGWDGLVSIIGGGDCDDNDPNTIPDLVWYPDTDLDGFGNPDSPMTACLQPAGFIADNQDCNDSDDTVYFGAPELCDGQDNSCSGSLLPVESDLDGDFYVDCAWDSGGWDGDLSILGDEDCNDSDATIYPAATEGLNDGLDQNCDGLELCPVDADGDLFGDSSAGTGLSPNCNMGGFSAADTDCDDSNSRAYPGVATEEVLSTACMVDNDQDGFGDSSPSNLNIIAGTDCNDGDGSIHPSAVEGVNDFLDQNCDGMELCYLDADLDTHGNLAGNTSTSTAMNCIATGFANSALDCNDGDNSVYPNATELCDGQMNDCTGSIIPVNETDDDGDGYVECVANLNDWDGVAIQGGNDCDDNDALQYPFGLELCDGIVNICGSTLDANEVDNDNDLYVECSNWTGSSSILGGDDCNASDGAVHPNAAEGVNDGIDQDCDGDELCYIDSDQDSFGNSSGNVGLSSALSCVATGFADNTDDCDDLSDLVYPAATEICDGVFNDCDDVKYGVQDAPNDELDDDGDFYVECDIGNNVWVGDTAIIDGGDCNPSSLSIHPWATEGTASTDSNCDDLESVTDIAYCEGNMYTDGSTYDKYFAICYKTSGDEPTWQEAETICLNHGYDGLASVSNLAEKNFLKDLLDYDAWIGLNDISSENTFVWTNGDTSTYRHWDQGEPDGSTSENCIKMNDGAGKWFDEDCSSLIDFVCSNTRLH